MIKFCSHKGCNNIPYLDYDECVLHCKKNNYITDLKSGLLKEFYNAIFLYIVQNSASKNRTFPKKVFEDTIKELLSGVENVRPLLVKTAAEIIIDFDSIIFPHATIITEYT